MAPRIDLLDILVLGGGHRPRSLLDELSGRGRRDGIGIEDLLEQILRPRSAKDMVREIDEAMTDERVLALQPVTNRSRVQLADGVIFIGPEGFKPEHPHYNILIQHLKKPDRWRLWSVCPHTSTTHAFHIKGTADPEEAVRRSNLLLDIGLGLVEDDKVFERSPGFPDGDHAGVRQEAPVAEAPAAKPNHVEAFGKDTMAGLHGSPVTKQD